MDKLRTLNIFLSIFPSAIIFLRKFLCCILIIGMHISGSPDFLIYRWCRESPAFLTHLILSDCIFDILINVSSKYRSTCRIIVNHLPEHHLHAFLFDLNETFRIISDIAILSKLLMNNPVDMIFIMMQEEGEILQILLFFGFHDIIIGS